MIRKRYESEYAEKRDKRRGIVLFPAVNLGLWAAVTYLPGWLVAMLGLAAGTQLLRYIVLLPWAVNGLLLLLAFIFRPYIAVGYLTFLGTILMVGVGLAILVVGSCLVSIPFWLLGPVGAIVFGGLVIAGLVYFGPKVASEIARWWS
jgi:hypothetical protein